ncbi:MAG: polyprenyl synthetase family protein [Bacteroidota bacterium]
MNFKKLSVALAEEVEKQTYGESPVELYEPISYIMALGGKRLRPMLTLIGASLYTENWQKALKPALAVEVFHNFTLLHDDIMDKAPTRRGKPTVHKKWNDSVALLSGDVMLVKAYELLFEIDADLLVPVLKSFSQTAAEVCEGQQLDMNFELLEEVSLEEYLNMIRLKTSVLLGFSLKLGAMLGGASKDDFEKLYTVGINAGIGFQLMDDILDVYGDPEKFGKQVGGDIISNKKTYLLILAKNLVKGSIQEKLNHWLSVSSFNNTEKVQEVTDIYNTLNIREQVEALMNSYFEKCFSDIESLSLSNEKKHSLAQFFKELMQRES